MVITQADGWVAVFRNGDPDNPTWETRPVALWQEYADGEVHGLVVDSQGGLQPASNFPTFYRYELNDISASNDDAAPATTYPDPSFQTETDVIDRIVTHDPASVPAFEQDEWATEWPAS
jgi:hypothetical protein